ncbi:glycosyl hydrolase family 8 [Weissella halotolerans]|uniref:Glucanase n=1 Tax=Weissella halotolerans DSM 20190 TaxID=1123500 RepID=A0A0R2G208_9LACO|nr:glycosyl hydrolase family 8 [Weissella halotolerans]KRN33510.1 glycoside hydrolase family protein [Weissella halotolerans DSM 20190]
MEVSKTKWVLIFVIIGVYIGILVMFRLSNPTMIEFQTYQAWRYEYVKDQSAHQQFVNTGPVNQATALSEGQGYGMQIVAQAGAKGWASKKDFDRLVNYYLDHRLTVNHRETSLMSWRQRRDHQGQWHSENQSATDGDLTIADALITAANTWPQRQGFYKHLAKNLADDILKYEYNPGENMLTVSTWATPDDSAYHLMRTSDVMPLVFTKLAVTSHDNRWDKLNDSMLSKLETLSQQHKSGLVPDFARVDGLSVRPAKAHSVATAWDGYYGSNACRVPMMLASSNDPRAKKIVAKMMHFFQRQGYVTAGYSLQGKPLTKYQSRAFSAPIFYAADANKQSGYDGLFQSQSYIFHKPIQADHYYDATLTTLAVFGGITQ